MITKRFQLSISNAISAKTWLGQFIQSKTETDILQKIKIFDVFSEIQEILDKASEDAKSIPKISQEELDKINERFQSKEIKTFTIESASLDWFKKTWKEEIPKNFYVGFKNGDVLKGISAETDCRTFVSVLTALDCAEVIKVAVPEMTKVEEIVIPPIVSPTNA